MVNGAAVGGGRIEEKNAAVGRFRVRVAAGRDEVTGFL